MPLEISSVQFSRSVVSDSLQPCELQHARPPCPSPLLELTQTHVHQVHDAIQPSSVIPFSSSLLSFLASGSFQMSQFFASGGRSISAFLPMNIQDRFPLGWTGWISLLSKGVSRVFSNITVQKHQFFSAHLSLWSSLTSIYDYWKNHSFDWWWWLSH